MVVSVAVSAPRSSPSGRAVTWALRAPSVCSMLGAVVVRATVATSVRATSPRAPVIVSFCSAARSAGAAPVRSSTDCSTPSIVRVPTVEPRRAVATDCPIWASVRPCSAAFLRSTVTSTTGWAAARLFCTSLTPATPATASCTCWAACASTAGSSALMSTATLLLPPPCPSVTVSVPTWSCGPSVVKRERRSSATFAASALSSSVTENRVGATPPPDPPGGPNRLAPVVPTVAW